MIDVDGKQLGVMHIRRALKIAQDKGLDLVEVAPNADPPVCRILDYGRYRYEQEKLAKEAKKKQKVGDVKTLRLRPNIAKGDIETKIRNAQEFLEDGDKVKFVVIFRSREFSRPQLGETLLQKIASALEEVGTVEKAPAMDGRQMVMVIAPRKKPTPKPKSSTEGGTADAKNEDEQNRRQAVQADSDGQTDAQEGGQQPPLLEQEPQSEATP